jgi:hypothetical protein
MTLILLKLILGRANLNLPNHGTAGQYTSETVCISSRDHLASVVLQKYLDLHKRYD